MGWYGISHSLQDLKTEIQSERNNLERTKFELQKLLSDVDTKADYTGRMDELSRRTLNLEEYLRDIQEVEPYLVSEAKLPGSLIEKENLINQIRAGEVGKETLAYYMIQNSDDYLARLSVESYFQTFANRDIDFTVKSAFSAWPWRRNRIIEKLVSQLNGENFKLFESALYKYGEHDFAVSSIVKEIVPVQKGDDTRTVLIRIRNYFESKEMPNTISTIDEILLGEK